MKVPVRIISRDPIEEEPDGENAQENRGGEPGTEYEDKMEQENEQTLQQPPPDQGEAQRATADDLSSERPELGWKGKYIRAMADLENYKRHVQAERDRLAAVGKEAVLTDIFPLIEHMERAISAAKEVEDKSAILEGLEMVYKELLAVLEKHGVERVATIGEKFDPAVHQAVSTMPHPEAPEDTVVAEVKPGFKRGERLLRPACVVVAK